jgi:nucleoside-diphosphate-sugar epimerase
MDILVTGSSGFLGSAVAKEMLSQGHTVLGVDIVPGRYTNVVTDVRKWCEISKSQFDVVFQFAATVGGRVNIENNYLQIMENVEIDRVVFSWAKKYANKIIYPSSSAVYPVNYQEESDSVALAEDMVNFSTNTIGVSDHLYGWSKLTAERMLWELSKESGLNCTIVRPFSGYGTTQSADYPFPNLFNIVKNNPNDIKVWGTGLQSRDFVYIDDIVSTLLWCMQDAEKFRVVNIGTGISTSFIKLIELMYTAVHNKECPGITKLINKPVGVMHRYCNTDMQQELGIMPTITVQQGIGKFLNGI